MVRFATRRSAGSLRGEDLWSYRLAAAQVPRAAKARELDMAASSAAAGIDSVLAELQSGFSQADADLAEAISRANGAPAQARATFIPSTESAEWERVSYQLQHAGFQPLDMVRSEDGPAFVPTPTSIRQALSSALDAYGRVKAELQSSLEDAAKDRQQASSSLEAEQRQADEELKRVNSALEAQLELARGRLRQQTEEAENAAKAAEHALSGLRHKVAAQSHQLKTREAEVQRLQEKLGKELGERDAAQKQREKQIFQDVHHRAARAHSAADSRGLELISVYEAQRQNMQREIDDLRAQSAKLADDLAEREQLILRKDATRSWRSPDQGAILGKLDAAQKAERAAREETMHVETRAAEQLRQARLATAEAQREVEAERARAACLALDLSARPTLKQWTDAQATIERLRKALPRGPGGPGSLVASDPAGRPLGGEDADEGAPRGNKVEESAEAIRRDKEVYQLGLHSLQTLPQSTMLQLLQDCCRELRLSDARLLPAALRKMCKALAALPPMEAFIRDVCALAMSHGTSSGEGGGSRGDATRIPSTKHVLQVLNRWSAELKQLHQLQDFTAVLSDTLRQRSHRGDALGGDADPPPVRGGGGGVLPLRDIASAVETLVQQERKALRALDSFDGADEHVKKALRLHPEDVLSQVCGHFSKLFEVKGTEGMMPKMNELYLYVNEQQNLIKVLKSMVGLPADATTHQLLSAMREALDQAVQSGGEQRPAGGAKGGASAGKDAGKDAAAAKGGAAATADADHSKSSGGASVGGGGGGGEPPKTLPQYVAIAAELRKLMNAPSVLAIVPRVKELQQSLLRYKQVSLQMQALIQELCTTLAVGSAEAMIAERIQVLAASPAAESS